MQGSSVRGSLISLGYRGENKISIFFIFFMRTDASKDVASSNTANCPVQQIHLE